LEGYNQDTFRSEENEEVVELFGFIDDVYVYPFEQELTRRDERDADAGSEAGSRRPRGKSGRDWSEAPSEITITTTSEQDDDDEEEEDLDPTPKKSAPAPASRSRKSTSTSKTGRRGSARRTVVEEVVKEEPEEEEEEGTEVGDSDHVEGLLEEDEDEDSEEDEMLL
jgi:hypothetical protein